MGSSRRQLDVQIDVVVPTQTRYLSLVGRIGEEIAKKIDTYSGDRDALAYNLNLVLTEAMTNAIDHGECSRSGKKVRVTILVHNNELCIKVYDKGQGFDINAIPVPDFEDPAVGGLGIFLIKTLMDSVQYHKAESGNILEMRKWIN